MVNHKEILRLKSLGLTHCEIADAAGCGRNTVTRTLARAREQKLNWQQVQSLSRNRSIIPRYRKVVVPGTHTAENHDFISPDQGSRSSISKSLRCATRSGNTLSR